MTLHLNHTLAAKHFDRSRCSEKGKVMKVGIMGKVAKGGNERDEGKWERWDDLERGKEREDERVRRRKSKE
jgi:hypothetical protein